MPRKYLRKYLPTHQSITGNRSITARLVAVPAPVEFLDEIRTFLGPAQQQTPAPTPPAPAPAPGG